MHRQRATDAMDSCDDSGSRSAQIVSALGLVASLLALGCGADPNERARPNIVLIVVDTLRQDHLGSYGYSRPTSPSIDRLAAESLQFGRATSQAPWTLPSVAALLSARYPDSLGIRGLRSRIPDEATLLPERLKAEGYATGAVISHRLVNSARNFSQGFESFDQSNIQGHLGESSSGVTESALAFIAEHGDRPFFLWLHYFDPHSRYLEHPGFNFPSDSSYRGPVSEDLDMARLKKLQRSLTQDDAAELRRVYDSEIAYTDHHIGRVLEALRTRGLYDNTVIVLTADHGDEFLDHGRLGHSKTLYEELVRIPLLMKLPGIAPARIGHPVALVDVYPTILDYLGLSSGDDLAGISLLPGSRIATRDPAQRPIFSSTQEEADLRAIVLGKHKLILNLRRDRTELYDLSQDPAEQNDLADTEPQLRDHLASELSRWMQATRPEAHQSEEIRVSPEEQRQLEALGYSEGESDR